MKWLLPLILGLLTLCCTIERGPEMFTDEGISSKPDAEPMRTGWSSSGELTQNDSLKKVSLQVSFPEAGNYLIEFKMSPKSFADLRAAKARAEITWSVSGNQVTRVMDITNGASISGAGESVKIVMYDASVVVLANNTYVVSVNVTKGTRASTQSPPTLFLDPGATTIGPLASRNFVVPANCGAKELMVLFYCSNNPGVATPPKVVVTQVGFVSNLLFYYASPDGPIWVPLLPNTTIISVSNYDAANTIVASVVVGIDG